MGLRFVFLKIHGSIDVIVSHGVVSVKDGNDVLYRSVSELIDYVVF
jgi:hypothetical protein